MGVPVNTGLDNFEEVILKLSTVERTKLAHWLLESVVEEVEPASKPDGVGIVEEPAAAWPPKNVRFADNPSGKKPWYADIPMAKDLTEEERLKVVDEVAGSWKDHPMSAEELIEDIYSSRTISTREINLDD